MEGGKHLMMKGPDFGNLVIRGNLCRNAPPQSLHSPKNLKHLAHLGWIWVRNNRASVWQAFDQFFADQDPNGLAQRGAGYV